MSEAQAADPLSFDEREPHERGFALHFQHHVRERLLALETERFAALARRRTRALAAVSILIGGAAALYFVYGWRWDYFALGLVAWAMALTVSVWLARRPARRYAARRKEMLVPAVLAFFGPFDYDPRGRIERRRLARPSLFDERDSYAGEDLITGTHGGRGFAFAEATFRRKERNVRRTTFHGQVLFLALPRAAEGTTIGVYPAADPADTDATAGRGRGLARVDDDGSPAGFELFGTHPEEARRLVDDRLREAIAHIASLQGATGVEFGVERDSFVMKVATRHDLFAPAPLGRTALETEACRELLKEVALVLAVIDAVARATA